MAKGKYQKWLDPEALILLEGWARDGLTIENIAHNIGITAKTLYEWKNAYSEISNALKKGREVSDYIIENALFKSALGYDVIEYEDKIDAMGVMQRCEKKRHVPANTTAQIFWLKNRRPDKWRDKREVEADVSAEVGGLAWLPEQTDGE